MTASTKRVNVAIVRLWEQDAGAVAWNEARNIGEFEYDPAFLRQGLEIAPKTMPLRTGIFSFPLLNEETCHRLPGLLADALPDRFGNRIIDVWLARNQDDHTRNIAFLMDCRGRWRLSPAFDVVWAYNPSGKYTHQHQISINGKRDNFSRKDLLAVAGQFGIRNADAIMERVAEAVSSWQSLAAEEEVSQALSTAVQKSLRLKIIANK